MRQALPIHALIAFSPSLAFAQSVSPAVVKSSGIFSTTGVDHLSISGDGRFVACSSTGTDLVPGDTNLREDVFLHDRADGTTTRINLAPGGVQLTHLSTMPLISADGVHVSYQTQSPLLVPGDTNGKLDVFVFDRVAGTTARASLANDGAEPNQDCHHASPSRDGRFVAFGSDASNLVVGDTGPYDDLFVRDMLLGTTELVSATFDGSPATGQVSYHFGIDLPCISDDGRFVVFWSPATNLVLGDTNGVADVFVRDRLLGVTERVSVASDGSEADDFSSDPSLSADGRFVAFTSEAQNLIVGDANASVDVFLRDRALGTTEVVTLTAAGVQIPIATASFPHVSADGSRVVFSSGSGFVLPDTNSRNDVFLRDRSAQTTTRLSDSTLGVQSDGDSIAAVGAFSDDGRTVAFQSSSTSLWPGDTWAGVNAFVRDETVFAPVTGYCTAKVNSLGCTPVISASGLPTTSGFDAFRLTATNLRDHKSALLFWGVAATGVPFQGGWLCVKAPTIRTPVQDSGGLGASPNCSGSFSFHFGHAYIASSGLSAGQTLYCQLWSRDPGSTPFAVNLTSALWFTLAP